MRRIRSRDAGYINTPPRRVPAAGQVLSLAAGDAKYLDQPVRIRVAWPRPEISHFYGGDWVWVHAELLGEAGRLRGIMPILVRVDAIPDDSRTVANRRTPEEPP
jgi:hypothetical protein